MEADLSASGVNLPSASAAPGQGDREDDDEDVCRICRVHGEAGNPLFYPCACSGSIKYVHQDCLLQWLTHSNTRSCEVCKHPFAFSPVYAENAPAVLPWRELLAGAAHRACRGAALLFRLAVVLAVWLVFIPVSTSWLSRLAFVQGLADARSLLMTRFSLPLLFRDCMYGSFLSAAIVFIFLAATWLREYFHQLRHHGAAAQNEQDNGAIQWRLGGPEYADPDPAGPPLLPAAGVAGAVPAERERPAFQEAPGQGRRAAAPEAQFAPALPALQDGDDLEAADDLTFSELVGMQGPILHLFENAITVLASNAVFLLLAVLVPFNVGRMSLAAARFGLSCAGKGFFGPWVHPLGGSGSSSLGVGHLLPANASAVLSTMAANFSALHAALQSLSTRMSLHNVAPTFAANATFSSDTSFILSKVVANLSRLQATLQSLFVNESLHDALPASPDTYTSLASAPLDEPLAARAGPSDSAVLVLGYFVILACLLAYMGAVLCIREVRGQRVPAAPFGARWIPSLEITSIEFVLRHVLNGCRKLGTLVKVSFLLGVELGLFPLMCGWWLDICTLGLLSATLVQRVRFLAAAPFASSLLHWVAGILYMLHISVFVSILREILRPGVLAFLRDPADPNYNPIRDLIDDPLHKHARRVLLSVVVYGNLIVMLVFVPCRLALAIAPSTFPLNLRFADPLTEIPADMLLFHVCIPFTIEHFRPRSTLKWLLRRWLSVVGCCLGLTKFLLPSVEAGMAGNGQLDRGRGAPRLEGPPPPPLAHHGHVAAPPGPQPGQGSGAEAWTMEGELTEGPADNSDDFGLRIVVLLLAAWGTLLLVNTLAVSLPVWMGRAIFARATQLPFTQGAVCNDVYAFGIGCYTLWGSAAGVRCAQQYLRNHSVRVLLLQVLHWAAIVLKSAFLLVIWVVVVPVLLGLLFELYVVVPLRVPVDESPVFLLYQDWALGLVLLKLWTRLVTLGHGPILAIDTWRARFERVRADGLRRLNAGWLLWNIMAPMLSHLLTALCVPFLFAQGLFPKLGFSLLVNSFVQRFAWIGSLLGFLVWCGIQRVQVWVRNLHNTIRDDRYLVGRRLHNFQAEAEQNAHLLGHAAMPSVSGQVIEGDGDSVQYFEEHEGGSSEGSVGGERTSHVGEAGHRPRGDPPEQRSVEESGSACPLGGRGSGRMGAAAGSSKAASSSNCSEALSGASVRSRSVSK